MKTTVLDAIGETALNLPAQIHAALMANDRIKYYFSLLLSWTQSPNARRTN
jgi:hypothetical protein